MAEYSENVMQRIRQSLGCTIDDTSRDEEIKSMSRDELFDKCMQWEGIIGYNYLIKLFVEDIYKVRLEDTD